MINKSATFIGTLKFKNGNQTRLFVGSNHNTGETIVWQQTLYNGKWGKDHRVTGRNIRPLMEEVNFVLKEGEAVWSERPTEAGFKVLEELCK